jgi:hypothetical protein
VESGSDQVPVVAAGTPDPTGASESLSLGGLAATTIRTARSIGVPSVLSILGILVLIAIVRRHGGRKPRRESPVTDRPLPLGKLPGPAATWAGAVRNLATTEQSPDSPIASVAPQHVPPQMRSFYAMRDEEQAEPEPTQETSASPNAAGPNIFELAEHNGGIEHAAAVEDSPVEWTEAAAGGPDDMFTGHLSAVSLEELVQFLNATKESGVLSITGDSDHTQGDLFFENGEIVHASKGCASGEQAVALVMMLNRASFCFRRQAEGPGQRTITQSTMSLLMNVSQAMAGDPSGASDQIWQAEAGSPDPEPAVPPVHHSPVFCPAN